MMCHSGTCDRADTYVYFWRSTRSVRLLVSSRSMDRDRGFLKRCTLNVLYGLHLIFCIFSLQEIKRLRQRPHFFVRLSRFFFLSRKGSWCVSTLTLLPFLTVPLSHCLICILCAIASTSCSVESWHFSFQPPSAPTQNTLLPGSP